MESLITTIIKRPYVFAFLIAYLFLAWRLWGWRRALIWLVSGYTIAWLSEFSSIHNGFPYGEYHYVYENLTGELLVAGVPFFDSLSYPFLIFAGFSTARFIIRAPLKTLTPAARGKFMILPQALHRTVQGQDPPAKIHEFSPGGGNINRFLEVPINTNRWASELTDQRTNGRIIFLGAILTTLLDIIIDPIATMGDKWFLGKIHWYAHPGWYFGVPLTNFGGWFLVSLVVILFNVLMWSCLPVFFHQRTNELTDQRTSFLGPLFYICIALFNIVVSFSVSAWNLGLMSLSILGLVMTIAAITGKWRSRYHFDIGG